TLPPPRLPPDTLAQLARDHWGVTGTLTPLTSERDQNHRLDTATASYTLKLANPAEPPDLTDFQTKALLHVAAQDPGLPTPRVIPARDGRALIPTPDGALRLLSWCPGTPIAGLPRTPALAHAIGDALARLTTALTGFSHPADSHILLWDIRQFPRLEPLTPALPPDLAAEVTRFRTRFDTNIAPTLTHLPTQVVHADFNPHNLLAAAENPDQISGILDFGDMVRTPRICDLAVAASYLVEPATPLALLTPLVTAYHSRLPLLPDEIALLPDLITARMLTTLTIATWRATRYPENATYILRNTPSAQAGLQAFRDTAPETLASDLLAACERPPE
ncbi:phosphotransferase, partial [Tabrizicola sp.]|uniref:phosphotransferase n=1 Tax=Tabrizicola sp. TaxID=2005166 RepID=UPI003F3B5729